MDHFNALLTNLSAIPLKDFVLIFDGKSKEFTQLRDVLNLPEILEKLQSITFSNIALIQQFYEKIDFLLTVFNFYLLSEKKEMLLKELELSKYKDFSSQIAAKTNLLNKLTKNLNENKKRLSYHKEDFYNIKNQRDQIIKNINSYKLEIQKLNKEKKDCFNQINKITRQLDSNFPTEKKFTDPPPNKGEMPSKAELIKSLQSKAKEIQYEIKQLNSKIKSEQEKLKNITPNFERLESDYNSLISSIKNDEKRIIDLKNELEKTLTRNRSEKDNKVDLSKIEYLKPAKEIEKELREIDSDLKTILPEITSLDIENPQEFSSIVKVISEFKNSIMKDIKNLKTGYDKEKLLSIVEKYRTLEVVKGELEDSLNNFLALINLKIQFKLTISQDLKNFYITSKIFRDNKNKLNFEELTTPEKVFLVISLYLSIEIILNSQNIIFSNLFIPNEYNKRGSLYRTIRKVLPLFEKDSDLKDFNLVFIISNLEMKKPIENIKIIKINQ